MDDLSKRNNDDDLLSGLSRSEIDEVRYGCIGQMVGAAIGIIVCMLICCLMGCATPGSVTNTIVRHDTIKVVQNHRDSVMVRDSIYVEKYMMGDTMVITQYVEHTLWSDKYRVDTLYKVKTDSVQTEKVKMVEKNLTKWQRWRMRLGDVMIIVIFGFIIWIINKIYNKIK